jgi:hypothetical protein
VRHLVNFLGDFLSPSCRIATRYFIVGASDEQDFPPKRLPWHVSLCFYRPGLPTSRRVPSASLYPGPFILSLIDSSSFITVRSISPYCHPMRLHARMNVPLTQTREMGPLRACLNVLVPLSAAVMSLASQTLLPRPHTPYLPHIALVQVQVLRYRYT